MRSEIKTGLVLGVMIAAGMGVLLVFFASLDEAVDTSTFTKPDSISNIDKSGFKMAPNIVGIADYINTTPEELAKELEGKVVLYDIWTYSCINCIRTLPYITAWDTKYAEQGLLVVGIHSPEFEFEKEIDNVKLAVEKHGINYPVVLDNDMETWKAFENRYWPRKYIADHEGYIRYDHIGEGAYKDTEKVIQQLLSERADALGMQVASAESLVDIQAFEHSLFRTPELYFGYKFAQNRNQLGSPEGFQPGKIVTYAESENSDLHKFYLTGDWANYEDGMELRSDSGSIQLLYNAKEVNIVTANTAELEILLDGEPIPAELAGNDITSGSKILTSEARLYNVVNADTSSTHHIEIKTSDVGFQIFTFTFG